MIYVNDCSIRIVRFCVKRFVQKIFIQVLHMKIIIQRKTANYDNYSVCEIIKIPYSETIHLIWYQNYLIDITKL